MTERARTHRVLWGLRELGPWQLWHRQLGPTELGLELRPTSLHFTISLIQFFRCGPGLLILHRVHLHLRLQGDPFHGVRSGQHLWGLIHIHGWHLTHHTSMSAHLTNTIHCRQNIKHHMYTTVKISDKPQILLWKIPYSKSKKEKISQIQHFSIVTCLTDKALPWNKRKQYETTEHNTKWHNLIL